MGTVTTIDVALHDDTMAGVALNATVPCATPKPVPVIVTVDPTGADDILRLLITGGTETTVESVNVRPGISVVLSGVKADAGGMEPV
jgi:hypothetical protein